MYIRSTHTVSVQSIQRNRHFTNLLQCPQNNGSNSRLAMRSQCIFCYLSRPWNINFKPLFVLIFKQILSIMNSLKNNEEIFTYH